MAGILVSPRAWVKVFPRVDIREFSGRESHIITINIMSQKVMKGPLKVLEAFHEALEIYGLLRVTEWY